MTALRDHYPDVPAAYNDGWTYWADPGPSGEYPFSKCLHRPDGCTGNRTSEVRHGWDCTPAHLEDVMTATRLCGNCQRRHERRMAAA